MVDVGGIAPDFELRDQHAQLHRLSDHRGRDNVLLVFYPFAFTGVCTGEMTALRDEIGALQSSGTVVYAISCDTVASLRAFADSQGLTQSLLSDFWPHGAVSTSYGVFNPVLGAADRGSFVIDRAGVVRWVVRNGLPDARNIDDYAKALAEL
ncbi:MAG TPA: peroxiredoxin [Mycobacteriales bacterium]|nr:peroxiredoxin [Mycobacteriales bacterium]